MSRKRKQREGRDAAPTPGLFAAVGDVHGHMHDMVRALRAWERSSQQRLSFVLQVGDFQAIRHGWDLASLPAPAKYRLLGDFADFYEERADFPWPVWFIGGNHEPFGLLNTMRHRGRVAHNCSYLGRAGVMQQGGLRTGYLSGISPPASAQWRRKPPRRAEAYYTEKDLTRASAAGPVDVLLLHEWPVGVATPEQALGRRRSGGVDGPGSETARILVDLLEPRIVFAGHTHWPHRSQLSDHTQFIGLAHIDQGRDAFTVFRIAEDGTIDEVR
jgi:predicted phosphodiesterase